ncbi:hypothetical protein PFISCL1PPCAC_24245, partial [Pristionchus fissidentatus]
LWFIKVVSTCLRMPPSAKDTKTAQFRDIVIKMEEEDTFEFSVSDLFKNHDKTLLDVDPEEAEKQVERYLKIGDSINAEYWVDRLFAVSCSRDSLPWTRYGKLVQYLARCQKYLRIVAICERFNLHVRHVFFMHYYVLALTERRLHHQAIVVPCAQFFREDDSIDLSEVPLLEASSVSIVDPEFAHDEDTEELDVFTLENNLRATVLLSLGRSFLHTENRAAAGKCLLAAHRLDKSNLQAENLLVSNSLLSATDEEEFLRYRELRREANEEAVKRDPREMVLMATKHYDDGDMLTANKMTTKLIDTTGLYQDALLIHLATLYHLEDADRLFLLAHRLVDAQPDSELSWYAVSLYYFVCKNMHAAKSFMNKATTMNECFGEGWLAFGHILAYDCEHEQAMNCYLRAARVLEKRFEPLLYIAMGHCYTNNLKLASDFVEDSCTLGNRSPIVWHEKGCLLYSKRMYSESLDCFMKALAIITRSPESSTQEHLLERPLGQYWEPLVNNIGHANRKLHRFDDAIACHLKALLLVPQQVTTLTSLAMCFACQENYTMATQYFHQALAIKPFSQYTKLALEAMISQEQTLTVEEARQKRDGSLSLDELKAELSTPRHPFMDQANQMVTENMRRDFVPRKHTNLLCRCEECGGGGEDDEMAAAGPSTSTTPC